MPRTELTYRSVVALDADARGKLVAAGAGATGTCAIVRDDGHDDLAVEHLDNHGRALLLVRAPRPNSRGLPVQALSDGRTLLTSRRCAWRGGVVEPHSAVIDERGRVVTIGVLGDGIAHVLADNHDELWVASSDARGSSAATAGTDPVQRRSARAASCGGQTRSPAPGS